MLIRLLDVFLLLACLFSLVLGAKLSGRLDKLSFLYLSKGWQGKAYERLYQIDLFLRLGMFLGMIAVIFPSLTIFSWTGQPVVEFCGRVLEKSLLRCSGIAFLSAGLAFNSLAWIMIKERKG